ncbi:MAG: right-handed parallel beta-helix repeat-containing protein [Rhodocyclaceae bacterium]|nr:right-handed parallel beta-helix repeat-containing protein [Rhodocyclaceae bacterium]
MAFRKLGAGGTALQRLLVAIALIACTAPATATDSLPVESGYIGEIRRDASGKLITVPAPTTNNTSLQQKASGNIIKVGPSHGIRAISTAAALAKDGDTIEIEAGDYSSDVAVWKQHNLVIRGVGGRARLIAAGASAEQKAIWVIRGGDITVENIEFTGARVPDKNGAGIRFEKGHLVIRNCRFNDNENGILTSSGNAELDIENSEFDHNGAGDGYSHNLYVGTIRKLRVTGSYFHHARVGHLLKSRAAENHILYNRLTDETDGRASYELEFPNGGIAYVIGNIIEQGKTTENPNIVSFGAEGYKHPANELYLINNTLIDRRLESGTFLAVRPGAPVVKAYNNLLLGKRPLNTGGIDGEFINNINVTAETFVLADRNDYRIKRESPLHRTYRSPGSANGISLAPEREYVHPAGTRPLPGTPTLPGARQTLQPDQQD